MGEKMMDRQQAEATTVETTAPAPVKAFAALMGLLILLQAFLGGRGFFVDTDLLKVHRYLGIVTFIVAVIQILVVFTMMPSGRFRSMLLGMSGFIMLLTVVQLMLGFSAKDGSGEAAAWHIFTGVFLTGAIAAYANTAFRTGANSRGF
jgi:hypothetical protein